MLKDELQEYIGEGHIKDQVSLKPYSTFKMGGPAEYYYEAETEKGFVNAIKAAHHLHIPCRVLGGASNIVIHDDGIKGLVIRNMTSEKYIISQKDDGVRMHISSGYSMTRLAKETAAEGLEGFEHHLGLPGTLGGALFMNSKWVGKEKSYYVGDCLERAEVISPLGVSKIVEKDYFQFGYDYSYIQKTGEYIVWTEYVLQKADASHLIQQGIEALEYRKRTQPFGVSTSGCFFKNVDGQSAGKMIDDLGLKGYKIGGAYVSDIHANFILNDGSATTQDVQQLIDYIKNRVKETYNVVLEQEVSIL